MLYVFCQKVIKSSLHAVLKEFLWKKLFRKNHRLPDKMMTWRETERTNAIHKNSQNTLIASRDHRAGICVAARNALPQRAKLPHKFQYSMIASKKYFLHDQFTGTCV